MSKISTGWSGDPFGIRPSNDLRSIVNPECDGQDLHLQTAALTFRPRLTGIGAKTYALRMLCLASPGDHSNVIRRVLDSWRQGATPAGFEPAYRASGAPLLWLNQGGLQSRILPPKG